MPEKRRLAKQPMLYIAQPQFKPAEVPMQTSFRTQKTNSETSTKENEIRMRNNNSNPFKELLGEGTNVENQDEPTEEKKQVKQAKTNQSKERRQRFHHLTLEEKVNYFFELSPHVPKMKCEVTTEDEQHKGYIIDYKNGMVHMKTFQRPFQKEIEFEKIEDIRLMGF